MKKNIHKNIRNLRKEKGYSQEKLAEYADVSTGAVSKWESGETTPDITNLIKLAQIFGVSVDFLIGYVLEPNGTYYFLRTIKEALKNKDFIDKQDIIKNGLKYYPNNLEIIYRSALFYIYFGIYEEQNEEIKKGIELLYKSLYLLDYSENFKVSKQQIIVELANAYSSINEVDKSISLLKDNNDDNVHDILIGVYLSLRNNTSYEALEYLSRSYIKNITDTMIIIDGVVETLKKLKNYKEAYNLLLWYEKFIDSIKSEDDKFFKSIKIITIANQAIVRLALHSNYDSNTSEKLIKKCKDLYNESVSTYGNETSFKYYFGNEPIDIFGDDDLNMQIKRIELEGYTDEFRKTWKSIHKN
ncbi:MULTISPECIES: helix-turn-helix domain-containing protein [Helcococcus]|uniref:Helix-turn-helix transcriptional regulator n=3 Tax=Helcococcus bovis TaxID=3153252 RepID=A0ABW9F7D1_9FIRM